MRATMYKAFKNKRSALLFAHLTPAPPQRLGTWTLVLDSSFGHFRKTKIDWSLPLHSLGKLPSGPRVQSQLEVMEMLLYVSQARVYLIRTFTKEPLNTTAIDKTSIHLHPAGQNIIRNKIRCQKDGMRQTWRRNRIIRRNQNNLWSNVFQGTK